MSDIKFYRYRKVSRPSTALDPFEDVIDWLRYLTSEDYLTHALIDVHKLTPSAAKARCKQIMPHVKDALAFIEQAVTTPNEASFVSTYYALLNLAKVSILIGPKHAELQANRWHGATYDVNAKDSQSVLTEFIVLKKGGTLALFYETMVGEPWPVDRKVKMSELYPYLSDVGHEYTVATGQYDKFVNLKFNAEPLHRKRTPITITATPFGKNRQIAPRAISSAFGLRVRDADKNIYALKTPVKAGTIWEDIFNAHFDRRMIFQSSDKFTKMPLACGSFRFTEELPIILVFFHLSSVARYKPEFLYSIMESRMWPVISAARRHCLYKFLILFWSHFQQRSFEIEQG
jgi:hypothetical protein